jgi:hypothetical protein
MLESSRFAQWLCDMLEVKYGLVAEPINIIVRDEDSERLTVYYGKAEGMPIGWILPGDTIFLFGVIFDAVAQGDMEKGA